MARILIVEDDRWSRRIVADVLTMRGHEVLAARGVVDAREQLALAPALVILDIHIPGGGGEVLLAEIRAREATRTLPVIAFTASAMSGDEDRFLAQGFTAYLSKPIDVGTFGVIVESFLGPTHDA